MLGGKRAAKERLATRDPRQELVASHQAVDYLFILNCNTKNINLLTKKDTIVHQRFQMI